MAGLSDAAKAIMLNALGAQATYASLHTADPGTTGTNEVTGGTYARQPIDWNDAAATPGDLDNNTNPTFQVPGGTTVTHFALWSAVTAGTYLGSGALSASETFGGPGQYTLTDADVTLT